MTLNYADLCPEPSFPSGYIVWKDYSEFSGEPFESIVNNCHHWQSLTKSEYHTIQPGEFYEKSEHYIYDILNSAAAPEVRANLVNKFIPQGISRILQHPGMTFADFGAGTGVMGEIVHTFCQKQVTLIDIPSKLNNFCKWRMAKYGWDVTHVNIPSNTFDLPSTYDIIYTDAVWEHLDPTQQLTYARKLPTYINPFGLLYFLVDLSGENENMPMHYNVDIVAVHRELENAGLSNFYGFGQFASLWIKLV